MDFFEAFAVIVSALLAAYLLWQVRRRFFRRDIGGEKTDLTVIITSGGNCAELEQSVKGLVGLVMEGTLDQRTKIVIANSRSSTETAEMARILEREYDPVTVAEYK